MTILTIGLLGIVGVSGSVARGSVKRDPTTWRPFSPIAL